MDLSESCYYVALVLWCSKKGNYEVKGILAGFGFPLQGGGSLIIPCKMCVFGLKYFRLRQKVKHLYKLLTCACGLCLFGVLRSMKYKSSEVCPLSSLQSFCCA